MLVILTELVMDPAPVLTCTVSVNVPPPPLARLANVSVALPVLVVRLPVLAVALIRVSPAAVRLSVSVTAVALLGPAFANVMT